MDDKKKEALEFLRTNRISQLATVDNGKPVIRAMYTPRIEDDFTLWFATSAGSNKIGQIKNNPNVCCLFYTEAKTVRIMGTAEIISDQSMKDELWENDWTRYWPDGKTDPDYILIKVKPDHADYLDLVSDAISMVDLV